MELYVEGFIWMDWVVEKIVAKHGVDPMEAEETFSDPFCRVKRAEVGKYRLYGRSSNGRYLFCVFAWEGKSVKVISVRDMTSKERRYYRHK